MNISPSFKGAFEIHSTVNNKKNIFEGATTKEFDINQLEGLVEDLNANDLFISKKTGELILPKVAKSIELTHDGAGLKLKSTEIMFDLIYNPQNTEKPVHRLLSKVISQVNKLISQLQNTK